MIKSIKSLLCLALHGITFITIAQEGDTKRILDQFAKSYQTDVNFTNDAYFGVKVDSLFWTIDAKSKVKTVKVLKGKPEKPTYYFKTDKNTLNKIDKGELNSLTGAVKAFSSDFAPLDVDFMKDFQPSDDFMPKLLRLYFHFWNRGNPEIIPFGLDYTRFTHGAQATVLYYQPGFRSGYIAIKKGQHANEDERSRVNEFPTLLIAIKGQATMILDGKKSIIEEGKAVLIPAGVSHEFLNPDNDQPFEGILLMFGDGA